MFAVVVVVVVAAAAAAVVVVVIVVEVEVVRWTSHQQVFSLILDVGQGYVFR